MKTIMNVATSVSSQLTPVSSASNQPADTNLRNFPFDFTDHESRDIQESTITSEGKNNETNNPEGNETKKNIVIKEELIPIPPHLLEPPTPTPGDLLIAL